MASLSLLHRPRSLIGGNIPNGVPHVIVYEGVVTRGRQQQQLPRTATFSTATLSVPYAFADLEGLSKKTKSSVRLAEAIQGSDGDRGDRRCDDPHSGHKGVVGSSGGLIRDSPLIRRVRFLAPRPQRWSVAPNMSRQLLGRAVLAAVRISLSLSRLTGRKKASVLGPSLAGRFAAMAARCGRQLRQTP